MRQKNAKSYIYEGLGFPIRLVNVPMIKVRGKFVPNINYNLLQEVVLQNLCFKEAPLTGHEVAFIRKYFHLTTTAFGRAFGCTHAAVLKWEKYKNHFARIAPSTEICIRLFVHYRMRTKTAVTFERLYKTLDIERLIDYSKCDGGRCDIASIDVQEEKIAA
jgi:DNA-binding XRE family transcriptional regulator